MSASNKHRVDCQPSTHHVVVKFGEHVIAESKSPVVVVETGLPDRYYLPPADVRAELRPVEGTTKCPYKGIARYYAVTVDGNESPSGTIWSYDDPIPSAQAIGKYISFWPDAFSITVDGESVS